MKTYAAYYDNDIRMESSSGGIFSVIAPLFDIVYGVAMTEDCYSAQYVRVENDISLLRGSKYLQASVGDTYLRVKEDLLSGKKVLFTGTGCQINGLVMFLGIEYDNLFLMDVVCHGVPSPKLWKKYVAFQESRHGKITKVQFRCKDKGWKNYGIVLNHIYTSKDKDVYMQFFLNDYCLRPSCYECHAKFFKKADMTIADFWGIEDVEPNMNDGRGTSLVILRTKKSYELFNNISSYIRIKEVDYEASTRYNPSEIKSTRRPKERDEFFEDLNKMSIPDLKRKYLSKPLWKRIAKKIFSIVRIVKVNVFEQRI